MEEPDNLKATMLHPFFRDYEFDQDKRKNSKIRNDLIDQLADELEESDGYKKYVDESTDSYSKTDSAVGGAAKNCIENVKILKNFFSASKVAQSDRAATTQNSKQIIEGYLSSSEKSIETLKSFPLIVPLFIKYNTALTSSAPCERLFSVAKHILNPYRCAMTDEHFEQRIMLKTNQFRDKI